MFLHVWEKIPAGENHIDAVRALPQEARETGAKWLQAIVNAASEILSIIT